MEMIVRLFKYLFIAVGILIAVSYVLYFSLNWNKWYKEEGQTYYVYNTDIEELRTGLLDMLESDPAHGIFWDRVTKGFISSSVTLDGNGFNARISLPELERTVYFEAREKRNHLEVVLKDAVPWYDVRNSVRGYNITSTGITAPDDMVNKSGIPFMENMRILRFFEHEILDKFTSSYFKDYVKGYGFILYLSYFWKYHDLLWKMLALFLSAWLFLSVVRWIISHLKKAKA